MSPLHPRMAEIVARLDATHEAFRAAIAGLSDEAAGRRPAPDRWSVAEVVDHLRRAESGTARLLHHLNHTGHALGPETATDSALNSAALRALQERATGRLESPERTVPDQAATLSDAVAGFEAARRELLAAVAGSNGRAVGNLRFPHPLFGELDYYQWVLFSAEHEARHTRQIRDVRAALAG